MAINGERPWMDADCPEPLRRLITKCWHQDPHMRPSCAEVMRLTAFMIQARQAAMGWRGGGEQGGAGRGEAGREGSRDSLGRGYKLGVAGSRAGP